MPVVLVPGLGLSADAMRPLASALGPAVPVLTQVLPSFGRPAAGPVDPDGLARLLLHELGAASDLVLVGHSAGCQVVVRAAALAPSRIAGLVLVGPTTDPRAATWPRLVLRWLRTAVRERPWQVPLLVRDYLRSGIPGLLRTMNRMRNESIEADLVGLDCAILTLRGRHDRIAPQDWIDRLADLSRQGRSAMLPEGAHMIPLTHAAAVAEQIRMSLPDRRPS